MGTKMTIGAGSSARSAMLRKKAGERMGDGKSAFASGKMLNVQPLDPEIAGIQVSYTADIEGDGHGIYKPNEGANDTANHERIAYELDQELGFGVIPETIIKAGPHGRGSVQHWVDGDTASNKFDTGFIDDFPKNQMNTVDAAKNTRF